MLSILDLRLIDQPLAEQVIDICIDLYYGDRSFRKVRDEFHGAERTIVMQRVLRQ